MKDIYVKVITIVLVITAIGFSYSSDAASPPVRIKDIAHIMEARENQLMGFGLVVGLQNTGDQSQTGFTQQALTNLLSRMGMVPQGIDFKSKNAAAVMVTATLPPFVKPGQKIDVNVSSVGDATSLQGGTLLITTLKGVDDQVYAVAQGSLAVGEDTLTPYIPYVKQRRTTAGRISDGALVEKEVPVSLGNNGLLTIVVNDPDFTTANRIATAIRDSGISAGATDAGTIIVPVASGENYVNLVSQIENLTIVPDVVAKIVVNERTGTVVIGENVIISPVAVSYAGIDVAIGDISLFAEGYPEQTDQDNDMRHLARTKAHLDKTVGKMGLVTPGASLSSLVSALNTIGAAPKDLISILQAMKKAGAIKADIEVI